MASTSMKLSVLNRRLHSSLLHLPKLPSLQSNPNLNLTLNPPISRFATSMSIHHHPHLPSTNLISLLLSLTTTSLQFNDPCYKTTPFTSNKDNSVVSWNLADEVVSANGVGSSRKGVVTVVLLGWLGAEMKHLRRYAEMYNEQGIHAVKFVVPVKELLCFDLGTRVERRIDVLANELAEWVGEADDRCLIFHTFSNTGWLVYGSILDHWKGKPELNKKIKGCIVDSGADPELNPKVWAAGFSAAILKKRSSLTKSSVQGLGVYEVDNEGHEENVQGKESVLLESMVVSVLEKLFSVLLNLPDVNKRLMKIITLLSENPVSCPQLYLYSTADKVIPYHSVESFMEMQRTKGMDVDSFNFQSSPHVDHFRTFSDIYTSQIHKFLKRCLSPTK